MKRSTVALVAASLLILQSAMYTMSGSAVSPARKILTGWIPYYSMNTSLPSAVANGDLVQEVMPFWFTLKSESNITDLYTPANPTVPMSTPLATMRDSGFAILPTITDGTAKSVLAKLLASPTSRTKIVNLITALVLANNFDGIDLDFEGFAFVDGTATWSTTQPNWDAFVKELSTVLHTANKLLSITTPVLFDPATGKQGYYVYDWASIAPMIDRLRIMTYDYSTASPGPIGPLPWVESAVQYAVSVVPASKIYIGVAGYGRAWVTKVDGTCPSDVASSVTPTSKAATFLMRDASNLAATYSATPTYNSILGEVNFNYQKVYTGQTSGGLATSCTATRTAWYQDARGYGARANLVSKYHLGGISAWTLGMEDPTASEAVRQVALAIAPDEVLSEVITDASTTTFGDETVVAGQFELPDKQPIAGLTVHLEIRGSGESNWRQILETVTDAEGSVLVSLILSKSTAIRMSSDATWDRVGSQSPEKFVLVSRKVSVSAPNSSVEGSPIVVTGRVQPQVSGVTVTLEKLGAGSWHSIDSPAVTDENGLFSFSQIEAESGLFRYRVRVSSGESIQGASSPIFSVVVY
jgi:spore germination protein YaaH